MKLTTALSLAVGAGLLGIGSITDPNPTIALALPQPPATTTATASTSDASSTATRTFDPTAHPINEPDFDEFDDLPSTTPGPVASPRRKEVVFFPTLASKSSKSNATHTYYDLPVHGYLFKPLPRFGLGTLVSKIVSQLYDLAKTEEERARLTSRLSRFLVGGLWWRKVSLEVVGDAAVPGEANLFDLKGKTSISGEFDDVIEGARLGKVKNGVAEYRLAPVVKESDGDSSSDEEEEALRLVTGQWIIPSSDEGFSVISDVDDTVKISEVLETRKTLYNTFISDFKDVPGAVSTLNAWANSFPNPTFSFVSGSPWHLHGDLSAFFRAKSFPTATLNLRDLSILDGSAFSLASNDATYAYKVQTIQGLAKRLGAKRTLVMLGDSTQKDPEVYGDIARWIAKGEEAGAAEAGKVGCIFIREVSGVNAEKEKLLNTPERFAKAFDGVDEKRWFVFKDYKELEGLDVVNGQCRPAGAVPSSNESE
ncbi:hypothetical protein HK102_009727 [Quaeritorhiza haematococci]|nr:hypothetical protein HK102_009727 [Quaeritorhiza haematococci]